MDINSELVPVSSGSDSLLLADGNIYEQIYEEDHNDAEAKQIDDPLNVTYEPQDQLLYSLKDANVILNSNATADESMAIEALRQLGSSAVYTKTPPDLPLLTCSNCDEQFYTTANFQTHSSICKPSQLKCYVCNKMFDRMADFNNHLVGHTVARPHTCCICSMLFVHEKDFIEHIQSHGSVTNPNQCKVCGIVFNRPSSLTNHMKIHNYQPGRAILNSLVFPKVEDQVVGNYVGLSDDVAKTIVLPSLNSIVNINQWGDYDLSQSDDFNAEVSMEVAQEMTVASFEDDKTNMVAVTYEYLNEESIGYQEEEVSNMESMPHQTNNKKPHECKHCNKSFMRKNALVSHQKLHSEVLLIYKQCKNCDEYLTDDESLAKHMTNCEKQEQKEFNPSVNEVQIVNNSKTKFYKHICTNCDKRFSTKQKLHRHMWIHRKKVFTCEICGRSFEKQEELDGHRLSTHQATAAYVCNECGKCFSSRQGLWEHNRLHGDTSHLYKCTECLKTFSSRQGYLIHKRAHNDERPYGCRFCWKSFRDGGTLRKHERIHTGERPHACPLCTRAFNQKVVLREHVRWLHAANRQPNEDGVYDCTLCEQQLSDKDDLCAHIVKHSDHLALLAKDALKNNINVSATSDKRTNENRQVYKTKASGKVKIEIVPDVGLNMLNVRDEIEKGLFECDLCGAKCMTENDLSEHARIHI